MYAMTCLNEGRGMFIWPSIYVSPLDQSPDCYIIITKEEVLLQLSCENTHNNKSCM